jgi:hypothetical protein
MKRLFATLLVGVVTACNSPDPQPTPEGPVTPRPRPLPSPASSSGDVDPVFHVGQQIFITEKGFKPETLVAIVDEEISWINETSQPVEVRFDPGEFESGPIEPAERATYTPSNAQAITYERADDPKTRGSIQVEPYFQPGEDPAAEDRLDADPPSTPRG